MRASIACVRCRRSKVRCVNDGAGTTCRACQASERDCTYSQSLYGLAQSHKRNNSSNDSETGCVTAADHSRPRKRAKSSDSANDASSRSSQSSTALDARTLTPSVWIELFDIFQLHYSADFPFIHPTTFLQPLRQAQVASKPVDPQSVRPPGSDGFLLAFLALTARYHPKLVAIHAGPGQDADPLVASRYYATAAEKYLANYCETGWGELDQLKGLLMLGLYEWGMCKGKLAWTHIGLAIRLAQAMGLQYQTDLDNAPLSRSRAIENEADLASTSPSPSTSESSVQQTEIIEQEVRRRTFWSCFIMDRYLSNGKHRPQMLIVDELRIQLPASERSFAFAEKVQTLMLQENEADCHHRLQRLRSAYSLGDQETGLKIEAGSDEGLASRYIRMVELFGEVAKWSCAGGRRNEKYPPWDQRSKFHGLHRLCQDFQAALPRHHVLNLQNTRAHISMKTSTAYVLMHGMYLLCQVMLNREYVPFIPLGCNRPVGPMDPPLFPPKEVDVPPNFWAESAEECFKSARDIIDLARDCQQWHAMVETPFMGFALYISGFTAVYCNTFPWMDPRGYMSSNGKGRDPCPCAENIVQQMSSRLRMANGWTQALDRMRKHYKQKTEEYKINIHAMSNPGGSSSARMPSQRIRGAGGGLEDYKQMEHMLEFGHLSDGDLPQVELATSRAAAIQIDETLTSMETADGQSTVSSGEHTLRHNYPKDMRSLSKHRLHGDIAKQRSDSRVSQIPGDSVSEPTPISPTVFTPPSPSNQPTPGSIYAQAACNGWQVYQPTPHNLPNAYMTGNSQHNNLVSQPAAPRSMTYSGPMPVTATAEQYVPSNFALPQQTWNKSNDHLVSDPGICGDDLAAFVDGRHVADYAEEANMSAGRGQPGHSWLSTLWEPGHSS